MGDKLLDSLKEIKIEDLKNKQIADAKEAWLTYILEYSENNELIYKDAYFYDFRELKEVFGYCLGSGMMICMKHLVLNLKKEISNQL